MIKLKDYVLPDIELSEDLADIVSDGGRVTDDSQMIQRCIQLNDVIMEDRERSSSRTAEAPDHGASGLDSIIRKYEPESNGLSGLDAVIAKYE